MHWAQATLRNIYLSHLLDLRTPWFQSTDRAGQISVHLWYDQPPNTYVHPHPELYHHKEVCNCLSDQ